MKDLLILIEKKTKFMNVLEFLHKYKAIDFVFFLFIVLANSRYCYCKFQNIKREYC